MNKIFSGLLPFEIILLVMGVIIFLVLLFLLVWSVIKQRTFASLLPFFLLPVVLVGYPSVQSIQFNDDGLSIQKYTAAVNSNPSDTAARNRLTSALVEFRNNGRTPQSAEALATVAGAQLALGSLDSASLTVQKAAQLNPNSDSVKSTAQEVVQRINIRKKFQQDISLLTEQLNELQASPGDTAIAADITQTLSGIKHPRYVDASSELVIAKAYAMMNQQQQSVKVIDQVLSADPGSAKAKQLKSQVVSDQLSIHANVTPVQEKKLQQNAAVNPSAPKVIMKDRD